MNKRIIIVGAFFVCIGFLCTGQSKPAFGAEKPLSDADFAQLKKRTLRMVTDEYPSQAKQMSEKLDQLMVADKDPKSNLQLVGNQIKNELAQISKSMKATAAELNKPLVKKELLKKSSMQLSTHLEKCKSLQRELHGHVRKNTPQPGILKSRRDYEDAYQNFDDKAQELFNTLAEAIKAQQEMIRSTLRNLL